MSYLSTLGWTDQRQAEFEAHAVAGLVPGRVTVQHRGACDVEIETGELRCDIRGRLYDESTSTADLPVVGDWVAVSVRADEHAGTIEAVLPRTSRFSRKRTLETADEQILAANIDIVLLVSSLNEELSLRRLERYLILARESGATPIVVLTKADLHDDPAGPVAAVTAIAGDIPVVAASVRTGLGLDRIRAILAPGSTAALLGSSGVGKSTLINALLGTETLETGAIRDDGKGRHTTTRRELIQLPGGAMVIDTPGMRELQLWVADEGLEETFGDVTELFALCRFSDCAHDREPGCAVKAALADGTLPPERWESYRKLEAELAHLERRLDKRLAADEKRRWKAMSADAREAMRLKGRRV